MSNNKPTDVLVPVSTTALAQSTVRNNASIPAANGAIRTLNNGPMTHERPRSADGKQY